jgi:hypothetical protein
MGSGEMKVDFLKKKKKEEEQIINLGSFRTRKFTDIICELLFGHS